MKKILIVEDNFDNLMLIRLLLEREGYQVISAFDGKAGYELACQEKPDLIALDLAMPVMDGWEFLKLVKADQDLRDIPVVVVTAHLLPVERHRALQAGGVGYVSKPFSVQHLVGEIKKHLITSYSSKKGAT